MSAILELFLVFLKVGCFSFGGAYAAIPLIREIVLSRDWLSEETLEHMIAVSESTPGPIMVNLATYVGADRAGIGGAAAATFAVVLPAFLIIVLLLAVFRNAEKKSIVRAVMSGLKPCVTGIILAVGCYMLLCICTLSAGGGTYKANGFDIYAAIIAAILTAVMLGYRKIRGKRFSPILLIVAAAGLGMVFYGV